MAKESSPMRGRVVHVVHEVEQPAYSLCAMITDWSGYEECRGSFESKGFDLSTCEYLVVDNTEGNRADAFESVSAFLLEARAERIVIHHQDVILLEHGRSHLDEQLDALDALDPDWAVAGNAGGLRNGWPVFNLSHPANARHIQGGPFPVRTMTLDENLLIVKRSSNLSVSHDLRGFHHYGVDLCLVADLLGWHIYVIDFFLRHLSGGKMDESYSRSRKAIAMKYSRAFRSRWVEVVTNAPFFVTGSSARALAAPGLRLGAKALRLIPRARVFENLNAPYPPSRHRV